MLEVYIDKKWFMFRNWKDFFSFAQKNPVKAGRAEAFWDWEDVGKFNG